MCGIFGIIPGSNKVLNAQDIHNLTKSLFLASEIRGKDASGLARIDENSITVIKHPTRSKALIKSSEFRSLENSPFKTGQTVIMGHTRMVTNGDSSNPNNNQPVVKHGMVCLHNGIIVNDLSLWENNKDFVRTYEVDTEILLDLFHAKRSNETNTLKGFVQAVNLLEGGNTFALAMDNQDDLFLATTNGSLYTAKLRGGGVIFASERSILERCEEFLDGKPLAKAYIAQIPAGHGAVISISLGNMSEFPLIEDRVASTESNKRNSRSLTVHGVKGDLRPIINTPTKFLELEKACQVDMNRIMSLRRCTRCVLPETFPFITFDEHGVCSQCHNHIPLKHLGINRLKSDLDRYRSKSGGPDCLIPLSGGRDSCYSLHLIKKELGLNPIAYTYDWGMVTDLARRNISRMCGSLGIEHILIAADIKKKRDNIQKNVSAWLRRPHLGTVPLFMAGDKHFFLFAQKLRVQMGLGTVVFGMNRLERTDFKVGFCGINEQKSKDNKRHYNMSHINKLKMLGFYAKQSLSNPHLLNSTIGDSLLGFASYYFIPKVFLSIFDYEEWQEQRINNILLNQYNWETAKDTKTTWRIGDGTAPFYNYIYFKMAGLTENDTLQSNKIREGHITREDALQAIIRDNQPRIESLASYCEAIGIDALAAVKSINNAPRLYA